VIWPFILEMEELAERFPVGHAADEFILITDGLDLELETLLPPERTGVSAIWAPIASHNAGQRAASQIFHAEHYCRQLHSHTCTAVPILDPSTRELMGSRFRDAGREASVPTLRHGDSDGSVYGTGDRSEGKRERGAVSREKRGVDPERTGSRRDGGSTHGNGFAGSISRP